MEACRAKLEGVPFAEDDAPDSRRGRWGILREGDAIFGTLMKLSVEKSGRQPSEDGEGVPLSPEIRYVVENRCYRKFMEDNPIAMAGERL